MKVMYIKLVQYFCQTFFVMIVFICHAEADSVVSFKENEPLDSVLQKIKQAYKEKDVDLLARYTEFPLHVFLVDRKDKPIKNKKEMHQNSDLVFNPRMDRLVQCLTVDDLNPTVAGYFVRGNVLEIGSNLYGGNKILKHELNSISNDPDGDRAIDDVCDVIGEWEQLQWRLLRPQIEVVKQVYANKDINTLAQIVKYPLYVTMIGGNDVATPFEKKYLEIANKEDLFKNANLVFNPVMSQFVRCLTAEKFYRYKSFKVNFFPHDYLQSVIKNKQISGYILAGITAAPEHKQYIDEICKDTPDPREILPITK